MKPKFNSRTFLLWVVLGTWIVAFLFGGFLLLSFEDGFDPGILQVFQPALVLNGDEEAPSSRKESLELPATWTPTAGLPTAAIQEQTPDSTHVFIEPTYTPLQPVSPTPTFFITPVPFFEGPIVMGHSVSGRPLEVYRFGTGPIHRMIVAGIHGGYEWNTTALADALIEHIQDNPEVIPRTVTLFILRSLNPDGLARDLGVRGRVNDNGVDLNRNFPVNWAPDWERDRCWNYTITTSGPAPGSEAETRALIRYVLQETRVTAMISYHSAALGIFPGGEPPHTPSVWLAETLSAISTYPYPPIDIGCIYTGTLPDWAASEGIASVDLELHNHEDIDFEENLKVLEAFLNWRR